jgi:hypothetical protein
MPRQTPSAELTIDVDAPRQLRSRGKNTAVEPAAFKPVAKRINKVFCKIYRRRKKKLTLSNKSNLVVEGKTYADAVSDNDEGATGKRTTQVNVCFIFQCFFSTVNFNTFCTSLIFLSRRLVPPLVASAPRRSVIHILSGK